MCLFKKFKQSKRACNGNKNMSLPWLTSSKVTVRYPLRKKNHASLSICMQALVSLSCVCHKKFPQITWLKTTEIYSLNSFGSQMSQTKELASLLGSGGSSHFLT